MPDTPTLLDVYKQYNKTIKKLDEVYKKLEVQQGAVGAFLAGEKALYDRWQDLRLQEVPLSEKIESLGKKIAEAQSKLDIVEPVEPGSAEAENLNKEITDKTAELAAAQARMRQLKQDIIGVENDISWVKENGKFSSQQTRSHGASDASLNPYMATVHQAISIRDQLQRQQAAIRILLGTTPKAEKDAALKWSHDNNKPLTVRVNAHGEELLTHFHFALHEAQQKAAKDHLDYLGKAKYSEGFQSGKYGLNDLENVVAEKRAKQDNYRAILPPYAAAEIPADTYIRGTRTWGIGKTNTVEKINDINSFLEKPFSANKAQDLIKIKDLFSKVDVNLGDDALNRVYTAAKAAQQQPKLDQPARGSSAGMT